MTFSKIHLLSISLGLATILSFNSAAQNAEIKQIPEVVETTVGESFTVSVALNMQDNPVSVVDMFLNFDPDYLEVQNISIVESQLFNFHISPVFNNETGKIKMSAFQIGEALPEGNLEFVEIEFLALGETDYTEVSHEQNLASKTMLAYAGSEVEVDLSSLNVIINAADPLSDGILSSDEFSLELHPNPATDYAIITMKLPIDERVKITLYDSSGRLIKSVFEGMIYSSSTSHFDLDLEYLADGVYAIEFLLGNQIHTEKLMVAR